MEGLTLAFRGANALVSYVGYLGKMIWPAGLAVIYPYPRGYAGWVIAGAALVLGGISGLVWWAGRRRPYLWVGWLWYVGTLVPVIGLVQVGSQAMADRYTYLPLVGVFIMVAWGLPDLVGRGRYRAMALGGAAGLVLIGYTMVAWAQVQHWQNGVTLFEHALAVTTDNPIAHYSLGLSLSKHTRVSEAMDHFSEALRLMPNFVEVHNDLGVFLATQGKLPEARAHLSEALRLRPGYAEAHGNLGTVAARQGKIDEAVARYSEALRIRPEYAVAHFRLGGILASHGRSEDAIAQYRAALRLRPDWPEALGSLARLLTTEESGTLRDSAEAVRLARRACELTDYQDPMMLDALAAAYVEAGRFDDGVSLAARAAVLATLTGKRDLAAEIRGRRQLYESRRAHGETRPPHRASD
jgi:Flp pilus assembly protein TadD